MLEKKNELHEIKQDLKNAAKPEIPIEEFEQNLTKLTNWLDTEAPVESQNTQATESNPSPEVEKAVRAFQQEKKQEFSKRAQSFKADEAAESQEKINRLLETDDAQKEINRRYPGQAPSPTSEIGQGVTIQPFYQKDDVLLGRIANSENTFLALTKTDFVRQTTCGSGQFKGVCRMADENINLDNLNDKNAKSIDLKPRSPTMKQGKSESNEQKLEHKGGRK